MKKLFFQIKLYGFKGLYVFLDVMADITHAHPYFVRQKIYIGATIIAISVTINSCSSSGNRNASKDEKKHNQSEITTTCYDSVAPITQVIDSTKKTIPQKKQKVRVKPPQVTTIVTEELSCYIIIIDKSPNQKEDEEILSEVEIMPHFPGGNDSLQNFIYRNLQYPKEAFDMGIEGRVVIQFVITKQGDIVSPKLTRSQGTIIDEEALRIVKLIPKWIPGTQNGVAKNVYYSLPIQFKIPE